jgi:hypothetical protein
MADPDKKNLNPSDEPVKATPNTQSTKPVAPGATTKADPDNIKTDPEKSAEIKAAKTDAPADAPTSDVAFERALLEKDGAISPEQQRNIDTVLGDHSEDPEVEAGDKNYLRANPHDPNDSLRKDIEFIRERDAGIHDRLKSFADSYDKPVAVITKLVRDVPADTPDEFTVWGASGHVIRMGHLRMLVMGMQ